MFKALPDIQVRLEIRVRRVPLVFPDYLEKRENGATPDFKVNAAKLDQEVSEGHEVGEEPTELLVSRVIPVSLEHPALRVRSDHKDRKGHVVSLDCPELKATTERMDRRERLASGDLRVKTATQDQRALQVSSDRRVRPENQDLWVNLEFLVYPECQVSLEYLVTLVKKVRLDLRDRRARMDHLVLKDCLVSRESAV